MYQDKITGAFHFEGDETGDVLIYVWTILMDLSFWGRIETILRIIFKKPPDFVGYKTPEYYRKKSFEELTRLSKVN